MWLELIGCIFFVVYVVLPLTFRYSAGFQRLAVFLPWSNGLGLPIKVDFTRPESLGLRGARNFYLESEPGIRIGVWHILPQKLLDKVLFHEAAEGALGKGYPIVLYLHGNSGSRATAHRLELYKLLQSLDYHVITLDYRGYADSTDAVLSERAVVQDALASYEYIRNLSGSATVIVWGHSIGTGVASSLASRLCWLQQPPDRLVLESPFNNIRDEFRHHPLAFIYRPLRVIDRFFTDNLLKNDLAFSNDLHITRIDCPILILHSIDDVIVPSSLADKLYNAAVSQRSSSWPPVEYVQFRGECKYGHEYLCRAPQLPSIIMDYVATPKRRHQASSRRIV